MDELQVKEFIVTSLERRGTGKSVEDCVRIIYSLWTKQGTKIAEYDPHTETGWYRPEWAAIASPSEWKEMHRVPRTD